MIVTMTELERANYHLAQNDYRQGSSVFEFLKIVIFVI